MRRKLMDRFTDKTVVITGGTSGNGYAAAQAFLEEGAAVVITGQNQDRVDNAAKALGPHAEGVVADHTELAALDRLAREIESHHGRIDALFANAGVTWPATLDGITEEHVRDQFRVNFDGPLFTAQKLVPLMQSGSAIVFTTSCLNQLGLPSMAAYSASKAALRSLTRTLAAELKDQGIRVNAVSPGPIQTPLYSKFGMSDEELDEFAQGVAAQVPMGRFGQAEEIAGAVTFLASGQASYITGEEIAVDGGWSNL